MLSVPTALHFSILRPPPPIHPNQILPYMLFCSWLFQIGESMAIFPLLSLNSVVYSVTIYSTYFYFPSMIMKGTPLPPFKVSQFGE